MFLVFQILDHWSSFKKYDKNNDGQLDLTEVSKLWKIRLEFLKE